MFIIRNEGYEKIKPLMLDLATVGVLTTAAGLLIKVALIPVTNIQSLVTLTVTASLAKKFFENQGHNKVERLFTEIISGGFGVGVCIAVGAPIYAPSIVALISLGMAVNLLQSNYKNFI